jgi:DNA repair protein RadC
MRIQELPQSERPRERLLRLGAAALTDRELLALLLGSGLPGQDAIELAAVLIEDSGSLTKLAQASPHAMRRLPGVGSAKAACVAAAFELGRRAAAPGEREQQQRISGSRDVAETAAPYLRGLRRERAVVVVCSKAGGLLRVVPLAEGGADHACVQVRDVLEHVLSAGGARFALAHNHPSGSLEPSEEDLEVTARLRQAADVVGLRFLDHVIVTEQEWARIPCLAGSVASLP